MNQLDRALRALAVLQPTVGDCAALTVLADILDGGSFCALDDSISEEQWRALRDAVRAYDAFSVAVDSALRMQGKGPLE